VQAEAAVRPLSDSPRLRVRESPAGGRTDPPRHPEAGSMTREMFLRLVDDAMTTIPDRFRDALVNIAIVVEDEPSAAQLDDVEIEPPDTLLGLYEGIPLTERQWSHGNALPDKITLFQIPIEDASDDDDDDVVVAIGETLIHEIGHYFGLSEEEIEEIEERYWRGDDDPDAVQ
jgi:predicted Zn-dependent protease with MMP-like domain